MSSPESIPDPSPPPRGGSRRGLTLLERVSGRIGRFRLRTVLTISMVAVLLAATGLTGLFAYQNAQYTVTELAGQLEHEVADRIIYHLDRYLETPHLVNQLCLDDIRLGVIRPGDPRGMERVFQERSYRFGSVEAICFGNQKEGNYSIISRVGAPGVVSGTDRFLGYSRESTNFSFEEFRIDRSGRILEKTLSQPGYDPRTRPWYQAAVLAGGPAWTPVYMWVEGVVSVDAVLPVFSEEHDLIGVLDTSLTLSAIGDFLHNIGISKNGVAFIIDDTGLLVASSTVQEPYFREEGELIRLPGVLSNDPVIRTVSRILRDEKDGGGYDSGNRHFEVDIGGERQLVLVTPYRDPHGLSWRIVVVIPESDIMEGIEKNTLATIFLILGSVIGTVFICILVARWITQPVHDLNQSARALSQGDWTGWTLPERHDELGELSESFRVMANQLEDSFSSLKVSEERYLSLFRSSADAILVFDDTTLTDLNPAAEKLFGLVSSGVIGREAEELFGESGSEIREMIRSLPPGPEYSEQTITRGSGEEERFMNVRLSRLVSEERPLVLMHVRDITRQRRAIILAAEQEALRDLFSRVRMILRLLPDPTFVIDTRRRILVWNKAMERLTGKSAEEMVGREGASYAEAIHRVERPILIDIALDPQIEPGEMYLNFERSDDLMTAIFRSETEKGVKYFSALAAPLYDTDGNLTGAIESVRDITQYKAAEETALMANRKLALLSGITRHDILNKIMISKGHIFLLEEEDLTAEQKSSVITIKRSLGDIERFIAFTRTYQELGIHSPVWQNLSETFHRAVTGLETNGVEMRIEHSDYSILADRLFEKVCYNLVENAIRHGKTLTRVDITAEERDGTLVIRVVDDGCGVPDDLKETIFERGYGTNTGFGLFLVREILSIAGITITETGQLGTGCRFEIIVPHEKYRHDHPGGAADG